MAKPRTSRLWGITIIAAFVCCLFLGQSSLAAGASSVTLPDTPMWPILEVSLSHTCAYWQFDDDDGETPVDAVGDYHFTRYGSAGGRSALYCANPIPNPDQGTFSTGDPSTNAYSVFTPAYYRTVYDSVFDVRFRPWTIEGWFMTSDSSFQMIVGNRHQPSGWTGWHVWMSEGIVTFYAGDDISSVQVDSSSRYNDDVWHHFAAIWDPDDGATGRIRLYLDGCLVDRGDGIGTIYTNTYRRLAVGARCYDADGLYNDNRFQGRLDEFRFSNAALDPNSFLNWSASQYLPKVYEVAVSSNRPDYVPKLSDVSMRSLYKREGPHILPGPGFPGDSNDEPNTLMAAEAYHVTRLDWVYIGNPEWPVYSRWFSEVRAACLPVQATLNGDMTDVLGGTETWDKGRMLDVSGNRVIPKHALYTGDDNTAWYSCANRQESRQQWISRATTFASSTQVPSLQHDDCQFNSASVFWEPRETDPHEYAQAACFCQDCIFKFHRYLSDNGITVSADLPDDFLPTNQFANTFLAKSDFGSTGAFTIFMVTVSSHNNFGLSGNGKNGAGGMPRLYLERRGISYNILDTVIISTSRGAVETTTFSHDGNSTATVYLNGSIAGSSSEANAVSSFGNGGHLGIPYQAANDNHPGDLAEVIIYDRTLSDVEREGVEAYLGAKYGGVSGIPMEPNEADLAPSLKLWLQAETLQATHSDGDPIRTWTATVGFDANVPSLVLPNGHDAGAPIFMTNVINGHPVVRFDGVDDFMGVYWFNMKDYVLNYVTDQNLRKAPDSIRKMFEEFQIQSTVDFYANVRGQLNANVGRYVPMSCNGQPATEGSPYDTFDFGIRELRDSEARPDYLYAAFKAGVAAGKLQIFTPPIPRDVYNISDWDADYPRLRPWTRQCVATSYACGGHILVPWDHCMWNNNPRYFGDPNDYHYLFKLVRDNARYFDGYDDAYVTGYELTDCRYSDPQPARIDGGSGEVCAMVRTVAGCDNAAAVIHLVEWDDENPLPFTLRIEHSRFFEDRGHNITMIFHDEQPDTSYAVTDHGPYSTASVPALHTWAMVIVAPSSQRSHADLNGNCLVDYGDLEVLTEQWLNCGSILGDLYIDGNMDFKDYVILAAEWLNRE